MCYLYQLFTARISFLKSSGRETPLLVHDRERMGTQLPADLPGVSAGGAQAHVILHGRTSNMVRGDVQVRVTNPTSVKEAT